MGVDVCLAVGCGLVVGEVTIVKVTVKVGAVAGFTATIGVTMKPAKAARVTTTAPAKPVKIILCPRENLHSPPDCFFGGVYGGGE